MANLPDIGDVIDGRYEVTGVCSNDGGMGILYFVDDKKSKAKQAEKLVLKYCKAVDAPSIRRFRREIRLLNTFRGNSKVAQLHNLNSKHDPPYYVMKYYADGDLSRIAKTLKASPEKQEGVILQMLACVGELHSKNVFHRDIKPQNFLIEKDNIVVSDLGLSMESGSSTLFTSKADAWGTLAYMPPEFWHGGFKDADAAGDVFMLGKSVYALLTERDPLYLTGTGVHPAIFHVIEQCCHVDKTRRYQRLAELQQAVTSAYDVILNRVEGFTLATRMLGDITARLNSDNQYIDKEVEGFLDTLFMLDEKEQDTICKSLTPQIFRILGQEDYTARLESLLPIFDRMVRKNEYGWTFADTVAESAKAIISIGKVPPKAAAQILDSALHATITQNQFSAMDTCRDIIRSMADDDYAVEIRNVLLKYTDSFLDNIEPVTCKSMLISDTLQKRKKLGSKQQ